MLQSFSPLSFSLIPLVPNPFLQLMWLFQNTLCLLQHKSFIKPFKLLSIQPFSILKSPLKMKHKIYIPVGFYPKTAILILMFLFFFYPVPFSVSFPPSVPSDKTYQSKLSILSLRYSSFKTLGEGFLVDFLCWKPGSHHSEMKFRVKIELNMKKSWSLHPSNKSRNKIVENFCRRPECWQLKDRVWMWVDCHSLHPSTKVKQW